MSDIDVNPLISQLQSMAAQARSGATATPGSSDETQGVDFATLLKQSIDKVNDLQQQAGTLAEAFEKGDVRANLAEVMVAAQKANISFQAITQVRNRLIRAYQDIMSMSM